MIGIVIFLSLGSSISTTIISETVPTVWGRGDGGGQDTVTSMASLYLITRGQLRNVYGLMEMEKWLLCVLGYQKQNSWWRWG